MGVSEPLFGGVVGVAVRDLAFVAFLGGILAPREVGFLAAVFFWVVAAVVFFAEVVSVLSESVLFSLFVLVLFLAEAEVAVFAVVLFAGAFFCAAVAAGLRPLVVVVFFAAAGVTFLFVSTVSEAFWFSAVVDGLSLFSLLSMGLIYKCIT